MPKTCRLAAGRAKGTVAQTIKFLESRSRLPVTRKT